MSKKILIGLSIGAVAVGAAIAIKKSIKNTKINVKDLLNGIDDDDEFYGVDESDNDDDEDDILGITEDYLWDEIDVDDDEDDEDEYDNSDLDDILSVDDNDGEDEEDEDDEIKRPVFNPTGFYKDGKRIEPNRSSIDKDVSNILADTIENSLIDDDYDKDDDINKYLDTLVAIGIISRDPDMILDIAFDPETGIFKCENNGEVVDIPSYDVDEYEFFADFTKCKLYAYKLEDDDYDENMIKKNAQKGTFTTERLSSKVNNEFLKQLENSSDRENENNGVQIIKCFDIELLNDKKNELNETGNTSFCEKTPFILNATYDIQDEIREKYNR